jgi:hypothetical protein
MLMVEFIKAIGIITKEMAKDMKNLAMDLYIMAII